MTNRKFKKIRRFHEAMSVDDILKMSNDKAAKKREEEEAKKRAEEEAKKNAPKITEIWIKKLNIAPAFHEKDTADIQITWSDGKVEDTKFDIGTRGKIIGQQSWKDPNERFKDDDDIQYRKDSGDGGYKVKDGYLQMDYLYRNIAKSLREQVKLNKELVRVDYPYRRDLYGNIEPNHKGNKKETSLKKAIPIYKGGTKLNNIFQKEGVKISDEDVRVAMVNFAFKDQPQIKWFYGKDRYTNPVWAFSRVKPDPATINASKRKINSSYQKNSGYSSLGKQQVYRLGNTVIYKLF